MAPMTDPNALVATSPASLATNPQLSLPQNFPLALSPQQQDSLLARVDAFRFTEISQHDIASLALEPELALNRTLDGFLSRIDKSTSPQLFTLVASLNQHVQDENLPELANRILNAQPSLLARILGLFNRKSLRLAASRAYEEAARIASGRSKALSELIGGMEARLRTEMTRLNEELRHLDTVKAEYRKSFVAFAEDAVFLNSALAKARADVAALEPELAGDPQRRHDLRDKLQSLESRALAVEGTLSKLPADQLVIRQLQNAGVATLQELATTMASRFASIKMTLLTIHGARMVQDLQRLGQQGADLDRNLNRVRSILMQDAVQNAATAPGNNRLAQAQQLQSVVADTQNLVALVDAARDTNQRKFDEARALMAQAREDMLTLGKGLNPAATVAAQSYTLTR
jgi:hypothetical protein